MKFGLRIAVGIQLFLRRAWTNSGHVFDEDFPKAFQNRDRPLTLYRAFQLSKEPVVIDAHLRSSAKVATYESVNVVAVTARLVDRRLIPL